LYLELSVHGDAMIRGTPLNPGVYRFSIQAIDAALLSGPAAVVDFQGVVSSPNPQITIGAVISASQFGGAGAIAPGTWIEIYGFGLSSTTRSWQSSDFTGPQAPMSLDGVQVSIGGKPAAVAAISPGQINAQVPDGIPPGITTVAVFTPSGTSNGYSIAVNATQPGLLAKYTVAGKTYVGAYLPDGTAVLPVGAVPGLTSRPARFGETIIVWGIGFGPVLPPVPSGTVTGTQNALYTRVNINIGNSLADILSEGLSVGTVGLYQINAVVPYGASGDAIPFQLLMPGAQSLVTAIAP